MVGSDGNESGMGQLECQIGKEGKLEVIDAQMDNQGKFQEL